MKIPKMSFVDARNHQHESVHVGSKVNSWPMRVVVTFSVGLKLLIKLNNAYNNYIKGLIHSDIHSNKQHLVRH